MKDRISAGWNEAREHSFLVERLCGQRQGSEKCQACSGNQCSFNEKILRVAVLSSGNKAKSQTSEGLAWWISRHGLLFTGRHWGLIGFVEQSTVKAEQEKLHRRQWSIQTWAGRLGTGGYMQISGLDSSKGSGLGNEGRGEWVWLSGYSEWLNNHILHLWEGSIKGLVCVYVCVYVGGGGVCKGKKRGRWLAIHFGITTISWERSGCFTASSIIHLVSGNLSKHLLGLYIIYSFALMHLSSSVNPTSTPKWNETVINFIIKSRETFLISWRAVPLNCLKKWKMIFTIPRRRKTAISN